MLSIILIIALTYAAFCLFALRDATSCPICTDHAYLESPPREKIALNMILFSTLSFVLRVYFLLTQTNGDVKYYVSAATGLLDEGFFGYYDNAKIVYPPLFNYTYCLLGRLIRLLGLPLTDTAQLPLFLLKLPATICDYLAALVLYRIGARRDCQFGFSLYCMYILNPAVIFDSAHVGQVDGIYSLFVLLTVWCTAKRRSDIGCFFFVAAFLFKYQTAFIFPVLLFGLLCEVFFESFCWKKLWHYLLFGCLSVALALLAYLPFIYDPAGGRFAPQLIFDTLHASVKGYSMCSSNAYNLWTLLGFNLKSVDSPYLFLTAGTWGTIHIVLLVCGSIPLFWRTYCSRKNSNISCNASGQAENMSEAYPLLGAWLITGVFCFSVKMMCRYLFPAIALLCMAYAMRPTNRLRRCVILFSVLYIPIIILPLACYGYEQYHDGLILPRILSAGMIAAFVYLSYVTWNIDDEVRS